MNMTAKSSNGGAGIKKKIYQSSGFSQLKYKNKPKLLTLAQTEEEK